MSEEISIGTPIAIFKKTKVKSKNVYNMVLGKVTEKLFEVKIEQCSINRKAKTAVNKYTKRSFIYTSKEHQQWEQMNAPLIKNAMVQKGLSCNGSGYFALLLLSHSHYNQDGITICGKIHDVGNSIKNIQDFLQGIVYENDNQVMLPIGSYSMDITPYELGYRYRTDSKTRKEVQKETEIKYLTLKVYKVEEIGG